MQIGSLCHFEASRTLYRPVRAWAIHRVHKQQDSLNVDPSCKRLFTITFERYQTYLQADSVPRILGTIVILCNE